MIKGQALLHAILKEQESWFYAGVRPTLLYIGDAALWSLMGHILYSDRLFGMEIRKYWKPADFLVTGGEWAEEIGPD